MQLRLTEWKRLRGFNRLFLILAIGWACFCAVLVPLKMQWNNQKEVLIQHDKDIKVCQQLMVERPEWDMTKNCFERIDGNEENALALYSFSRFWVYDALFWKIVIPAILLPPAFFYGIIALVRWLISGFVNREA